MWLSHRSSSSVFVVGGNVGPEPVLDPCVVDRPSTSVGSLFHRQAATTCRRSLSLSLVIILGAFAAIVRRASSFICIRFLVPKRHPSLFRPPRPHRGTGGSIPSGMYPLYCIERPHHPHGRPLGPSVPIVFLSAGFWSPDGCVDCILCLGRREQRPHRVPLQSVRSSCFQSPALLSDTCRIVVASWVTVE